MEIISNSINDTLKIGSRIAKNLAAKDIICLFGELGSGKTVLTKGVARGLGIEKGKVISPTFVLIREHNEGRLPLYHFDLYRLKNAKNILSLGYEEYLFGDGVSVIEWADRFKCLLPEEYLRIDLETRGPNKRKIKISAFGGHYEKIIKSLKTK